jgi:hypothetical protein
MTIFHADLVAGMQPAVAIDGFGGCLFISPVALHDAAATDKEFVILADLYLNARNGFADTFRSVVFRAIDADDRTGLGEAVALKKRQAEAEEKL